MNELIIKINKKTQKPEYIGILEPLENGCKIITTIAGNLNAIFIEVPTKDCNTCERYLAGKCDQIAYDEKTDTSLCPYDKEEETQ